MDYTRTPGPPLSLNYHGALWEEGQQAGGVDSEGIGAKRQGGRGGREKCKSNEPYLSSGRIHAKARTNNWREIHPCAAQVSVSASPGLGSNKDI